MFQQLHDSPVASDSKPTHSGRIPCTQKIEVRGVVALNTRSSRIVVFQIKGYICEDLRDPHWSLEIPHLSTCISMRK